VCWFLQQQIALRLVPASCGGRSWIMPAVCAFLALVLVAATLLSWRFLRALPLQGDRAGFTERRSRFIAVLGTLSPLFFRAALAWQGIAELIYSGCEL
jgi:hypothetical protein